MSVPILIPQDDIRVYPRLGTQSAIDRALASLPAELRDAKGAFIAVEAEADTRRVEVTVYARLDSGWSFGGVIERAWSGGELTARAQVLKVWR